MTSNIKRREFVLKMATVAATVSLSIASLDAIAGTEQSYIKSVHINKAQNGQLILSVPLKEKTKVKVFTLSNPNRLVIDINNAKAKKNIDILGNAAYAINGIRHAIRKNKSLRIVLDMKGSAKAKPVLRGNRLDVALTVNGIAAANNVTKKKPAKKQPIANTTPKKARKQHTFVVAIDAGHGGKDPGAVGYRGTREKDVVLDIARQLKSIIDRAPGMKAVLIRDGDYYVSLRKRMDVARDNRADLFVSIHADANPSRRLTGSSVYILSQKGASSEAARFMAKRENEYENKLAGANLNGKSDTLSSLLLDMSQEETIGKSLNLAKSTLIEIGKVNSLLHDRVESAAFMVLKSPDIPSVLVETAFISNPTEEKKLRTRNHQQKIAHAMFRGIKRYQVADAKGTSTQYSVLESNGFLQYDVKSGDTLSEIADTHGVSMRELRRVNNLRNNRLRVGQRLEIPKSLS